MQTNAIPTSAPGDRAPTSEEPALIKMTNQHTKLDQAMPVRRPPHTLSQSRVQHCALSPFPRQTKLPARFTCCQPDTLQACDLRCKRASLPLHKPDLRCKPDPCYARRTCPMSQPSPTVPRLYSLPF